MHIYSEVDNIHDRKWIIIINNNYFSWLIRWRLIITIIVLLLKKTTLMWLKFCYHFNLLSLIIFVFSTLLIMALQIEYWKDVRNYSLKFNNAMYFFFHGTNRWVFIKQLAWVNRYQIWLDFSSNNLIALWCNTKQNPKNRLA